MDQCLMTEQIILSCSYLDIGLITASESDFIIYDIESSICPNMPGYILLC